MDFSPLVPFEPVSTEKIPAGANWVAQIKWDGVRMLTYYDGQSVKMFNRRLNERTLQYPEFHDITAYCSAETVILDGEMIALENGKPSFHQVMKRDGLRTKHNIDAACRNLPVTYMLFDVLFYNGEWVIGKSLHERQQLLSGIVKQSERVQLVQNFAETEHLFSIVETYGLEGIVCKDLNSHYAINGKDNRWQKKKNYLDVVAVVGGVTFRNKVVNAVLLGLYNEQRQLVYIGHAGTGKLSVNDWMAFTKRIEPLIIEQRPFVNNPERHKDAAWIKPIITVRIRFIEWTHNGTLRQPSIQTFMTKPAEDCTFADV